MDGGNCLIHALPDRVQRTERPPSSARRLRRQGVGDARGVHRRSGLDRSRGNARPTTDDPMEWIFFAIDNVDWLTWTGSTHSTANGMKGRPRQGGAAAAPGPPRPAIVKGSSSPPPSSSPMTTGSPSTTVSTTTLPWSRRSLLSPPGSDASPSRSTSPSRRPNPNSPASFLRPGPPRVGPSALRTSAGTPPRRSPSRRAELALGGRAHLIYKLIFKINLL